MAQYVFNQAKAKLGDGTINWTSAAIWCLLVKGGWTMTVDDDNLSAVGTNETSGTNYARKLLGSRVVNVSDTNDRAEYDAADITWTAAGFTAVTAALVYLRVGADDSTPGGRYPAGLVRLRGDTERRGPHASVLDVTFRRLHDHLAAQRTSSHSLSGLPKRGYIRRASRSRVVAVRRCRVFRGHQQKKAAKEYERALEAWQQQRDTYVSLLDLAQNYKGEGDSEILLQPGEAVFAKVSGAALVEERRGAGQWQGRSRGFSVPVASIHGRSIRYRTGASRGHFVQGAPVPTAIDRGNLFITNRRAVFQGTKQTRECLFSKLVGIQHDDDVGQTVFSVSNRQKPTCVQYGPRIAGWVDFRLDLAMAHFRGTVDALVDQVRQDLAAIESNKPTEPSRIT